MKNNDVFDISGIRLWKACKGVFYAKVPYTQRGLMKGRKPVGDYYRGGRRKYLQYEMSPEEAEKLRQTENLSEVR